MRNAKIVLVAEWTGWCGSCTAERPLVLTRSGGQGLRAWLTARSAPDELLVLTCRLCGVGGPVPSEDDDPEVPLEDDELALPPAPRALLHGAPLHGAPLHGAPLHGAPLPAVAAVLSAEPPPVVPPRCEVTASAEVSAARQLVGAGLAALLARRTEEAQHATVPLAPVTPAPVTPAPVAVTPLAPPLPLPRTSAESVRLDGIEALQLLAEGIDLLAPSRP